MRLWKLVESYQNMSIKFYIHKMICPCSQLWAFLAAMSTRRGVQGLWLHMDFTPPQGALFVRCWAYNGVCMLWQWFQRFPYFFLIWFDVPRCGSMWHDVAWCELGFSVWPSKRGCIFRFVSVWVCLYATQYIPSVHLFFHTLCANMGAAPLSQGHPRGPMHLCGAHNTLQTYEALKTCEKTSKPVYYVLIT